jgi:hypothetical protein
MVLFLAFVSFTNALLLVDSGQGLKFNDGTLVEDANLTVFLYDNAGNLIYNESFSNAISNGQWNVMLGANKNLSLRYGYLYYKDYRINGEEISYIDDNDVLHNKMPFYSSLGTISGNFIENSSIKFNKLMICPEGQILKTHLGYWTCSDDFHWIIGNAYLITNNTDLMVNETFLNQTIRAISKALDNSLNSSLSSRIDDLYAKTNSVNASLSSKINSINSSSNIKSLGFNTTEELNSGFNKRFISWNNESGLNVHSAAYWSGFLSIQSKWLKSFGTILGFDEELLNTTIDSISQKYNETLWIKQQGFIKNNSGASINSLEVSGTAIINNTLFIKDGKVGVGVSNPSTEFQISTPLYNKLFVIKEGPSYEVPPRIGIGVSNPSTALEFPGDVYSTISGLSKIAFPQNSFIDSKGRAYFRSVKGWYFFPLDALSGGDNYGLLL